MNITKEEIKSAGLQHVEDVKGGNACYDSFVAGVEYMQQKLKQCNVSFRFSSSTTRKQMDLFSKIQQSIYELESLNSQRGNIKITTSFITKRLFEEAVSNYSSFELVKLNANGSKIFGIDISFNHFSNDIVIYDETRACIDERFKITVVPHIRFVANGSYDPALLLFERRN